MQTFCLIRKRFTENENANVSHTSNVTPQKQDVN